MKLTSIILLGMLAFLGGNLQAQTLDEPRVKILPTADQDVIRVIYAYETTQPLKLKFITSEGVVGSDKINGGPYPIGVMKRYDVGNINDRDFWVVITSAEMSVTYRIVPSKNKKNFTPHLEEVTYNQAVVTANK